MSQVEGFARKVYFSTLPWRSSGTSGNGLPLPPKRLMSMVGGGNFEEIGEGLVRLLVDLGNLQSSYRVLDVGCGVGRVAIPLASYLSNGSYEGFDINSILIKWCQRHISSRLRNFKFCVADTRGQAENWRFPYEDGSFDLVFLFSVFTHMYPMEVNNYVSEISRVLRREGRVVATYFLVNPMTQELLKTGKATQSFTSKQDNCYVAHPDNPRSAIGYDEEFILRLYRVLGLEVKPIRYGTWRNEGVNSAGYQDIVVGFHSYEPWDIIDPTLGMRVYRL